MNIRPRVLLVLCVLLFLLSVGVTYYRTYVQRDFEVVDLSEPEEEEIEALVEPASEVPSP